jgi:hypothetical protein|uniref:Uncharacterized protein n=1 Tax=Picea glauca TaxID=3330 RepID=A0A124GN62_PICGL|nr:hypothetical protein ABT39_MTgene4836 [Picea glauca]QHR88774.1 hypothetical protein Q903MT_gene2789 [Picea sitchensis]
MSFIPSICLYKNLPALSSGARSTTRARNLTDVRSPEELDVTGVYVLFKRINAPSKEWSLEVYESLLPTKPLIDSSIAETCT